MNNNFIILWYRYHIPTNPKEDPMKITPTALSVLQENELGRPQQR